MYALPCPWIEYATFSRWSQATTFNEQPPLCWKCETSPCQWPILTQRAGASSVASPRSSISSERDLTMLRVPRSELPTTPNKSADIAPRAHQFHHLRSPLTSEAKDTNCMRLDLFSNNLSPSAPHSLSRGRAQPSAANDGFSIVRPTIELPLVTNKPSGTYCRYLVITRTDAIVHRF
jgi:hypothetical protein